MASTKDTNSDIRFLVNRAKFLVARLERLSADSFWAHRASGLRGSLLRSLDAIEGLDQFSPEESAEKIQILIKQIEQAYIILANAAREIRVPDKP
jgi:hypothetical protein